uniref:Uncharacterized protein n=1 Tax=Phage sp. ctgh419 TaxID=2828009 RepID=A0A8S5SKR9_9VIRU|nr:MAG TPA: hypothetical protein [Phage sp. ctgh419]
MSSDISFIVLLFKYTSFNYQYNFSIKLYILNKLKISSTKV